MIQITPQMRILVAIERVLSADVRGAKNGHGRGVAIGAADADGRQTLSGIRLGFSSSDASSTGIRMAPDGSPGFLQARLKSSSGGRGAQRCWSARTGGFEGGGRILVRACRGGG